MQEINIQITIEEANLILEGLGNMPFIKVYTLISKIQEQADEQLNTNGDGSPLDGLAATPSTHDIGKETNG